MGKPVEYPQYGYSQYEIDAHTDNLQQLLLSNNLRMSDSAVPKNGDCLLISSYRAHMNDYTNDGSFLRNQLIQILNPDNPESEVYRNNYILYFGNENAYAQQYENFVNRSQGYWNSRLFDLMPHIISDVLNRPILIFDSSPNSDPYLIIGHNLQASEHFEHEPILIARNQAIAHYENVSPITVANASKQKKITIDPGIKYMNTNSAKTPVNIPSCNRKIGSRVSGITYCQNNNIKRVHRYENKTFLLILLLIIWHQTHNQQNENVRT